MKSSTGVPRETIQKIDGFLTRSVEDGALIDAVRALAFQVYNHSDIDNDEAAVIVDHCIAAVAAALGSDNEDEAAAPAKPKASVKKASGSLFARSGK